MKKVLAAIGIVGGVVTLLGAAYLGLMYYLANDDMEFEACSYLD